jgi:hypothetical protein
MTDEGDDPADPAGDLLRTEPGPLLAAEDDLPPIVARLVVEIRSDGSRTIARGALEDRAQGQTVAIEADAGSPLQLVKKLVGSLWQLPSLARSATARMLPRRRKR